MVTSRATESRRRASVVSRRRPMKLVTSAGSRCSAPALSGTTAMAFRPPSRMFGPAYATPKNRATVLSPQDWCSIAKISACSEGRINGQARGGPCSAPLRRSPRRRPTYGRPPRSRSRFSGGRPAPGFRISGKRHDGFSQRPLFHVAAERRPGTRQAWKSGPVRIPPGFRANRARTCTEDVLLSAKHEIMTSRARRSTNSACVQFLAPFDPVNRLRGKRRATGRERAGIWRRSHDTEWA